MLYIEEILLFINPYKTWLYFKTTVNPISIQEAKELLELMPLDCNSAVKSILREASPSKSITTLAADTGISKNMVSNTKLEFRELRGLESLVGVFVDCHK